MSQMQPFKVLDNDHDTLMALVRGLNHFFDKLVPGGYLPAEGVVDSLNVADDAIIGGDIFAKGNKEVWHTGNLPMVTRTFIGDAGTNILQTVFEPQVGMLYVNQTVSSRYLIASFFKQSASTAPVLTVLASNGLTLGTPTTSGTVPIVGSSAPVNVRMRSFIYQTWA